MFINHQRSQINDDTNRTLFCGNLSEQVTDEILYKLFYQAGPIETIRRPKDKNGVPKPYAFIVYKNETAVPYALYVFSDTRVCGRLITLKSKSTLTQQPVLDSGPSYDTSEDEYEDEYEDDKPIKENLKIKTTQNMKNQSNEPQSWAEFRALKGQLVSSTSHNQPVHQIPPEYKTQPSNHTSHYVPMEMLNYQPPQQNMMMFSSGLGYPVMSAIPYAGLFNMSHVIEQNFNFHSSQHFYNSNVTNAQITMAPNRVENPNHYEKKRNRSDFEEEGSRTNESTEHRSGTFCPKEKHHKYHQ